MQPFVTDELIWALHRERVNAGVRQWLASRGSDESGNGRTPKQRPTMLSRWGLLPAALGRHRCCVNP